MATVAGWDRAVVLSSRCNESKPCATRNAEVHWLSCDFVHMRILRTIAVGIDIIKLQPGVEVLRYIIPSMTKMRAGVSCLAGE